MEPIARPAGEVEAEAGCRRAILGRAVLYEQGIRTSC